MDYFTFDTTYRIWICKVCQHGVVPQQIRRHITPNKRHRSRYYPGRKRLPGIEVDIAVAEACAIDPWDPDNFSMPFTPPLPSSRPITGLTLYPGYRCPETGCTYAARSTETIRAHRRIVHKRKGRPGRAPSTEQGHCKYPIYCQRVFVTGKFAFYFEVTPEAQERRTRDAANMTEADFIASQTNEAILRSDGLAADEDDIAPAHKDITETSPWLELTRWPEYVRGRSFSHLAALTCLPDPQTEPILVAFEKSVDRLIQAAYTSITTHRINEFDQVRINSFLQRQGVWVRPIQIHLRKSTYRRYRQDWVGLISFVFRTTRGEYGSDLRHQITHDQLVALDRMEDYARETLIGDNGQLESRDHLSQKAGLAGDKMEPISSATQRLDNACLDLSIALLDHELRGDIFESAVIGFLAALGVDAANQTYRDPTNYTGHLSGLVKISQMLVAQYAVQLAENGDVEYPGDALDEMRSRFLMFGVRAPFGWITRLRTYGKRIQSTTTSLGYLIWSDDQQRLSYRDLTLTMDGFRALFASKSSLHNGTWNSCFYSGKMRSGKLLYRPCRSRSWWTTQ